MSERLLSIREAAAILRMNEEVIRRWLRDGRLAGIKVGHLWRISADTIATLTHGRKQTEEEDEDFPSCVCFPRWLEFSGLPGLVTARHGPPAWNALRSAIELDCQHNETPGQQIRETLSALVLKTGLDARTLERAFKALKKDGYLEFRIERAGDLFEMRLTTPIQTPISVFEVDYRFGGLKNATSDYGERSCVLRYIK